MAQTSAGSGVAGAVPGAGPAAAPVLAVVGSTGTGKSQLAVELAELVRTGGLPSASAEVISADSMQTYRGLDVITNKAPRQEMRDVPHHLLSFLEPGREYDITQFRADAQRLCAEMHARNTLPILVGGTTYYIQHLLFPGRLVSAEAPDAGVGEVASPAERAALEQRVAQLPAEQQALWASLRDAPNAAPPDAGLPLWQLLHALDPQSASRWHYNDHRKVYRSLRILHDTGRSQSHWVQTQEEREAGGEATDATDAPRLLFWVHSEREVLAERLDRRIHRMVDRGLLDEIGDLRRIAGSGPDYTRGIFQAIGASTWPPPVLTPRLQRV